MRRSNAIWPRRAALWLGNGLIVLGLALLLGTGALFGYSQYEQAQADREVTSLGPVDTPESTPIAAVAVSPPAISAPTATDSPVQNGTPEAAGVGPAVLVLPTLSPTPSATSTPVPILPVVRIVATSIRLDSKVIESPIVNGEWVVPKFAVGHLQGTAQPLQGSNVVLSGHIQSLSSGNVFARIGSLRGGDVIRLYTSGSIVDYVVSKVLVVPNDDLEVIQPGSTEEVTLITCTGTWLPVQRDYDRRIVVVATRTT